MDLTLPQRLYLLSYDTDKNRFDPVSAAYRGQLLCAAALADLTLGGLLSPRDGKVTRAIARAPKDPFLARVLSDLSPNEPHHWINLLYLQMGRAEEMVRGELVADGAVTVRRGRTLGVFPTRTVVLDRPEEVSRLRERTRDAVLGGRDAAAVPLQDAAMVAIAAEGDVWTVFAPNERWRHRPAVRALQERFDAAAPGLRNAVRTAVMATGKGASA
ncbi:GOLPH3/VPS74 family protein [Nocardiopsis synnemataformans]|uniref:GOLPH3/VPS74 family protein n=1 Tax=Nocardiopsis synnemataformans TaxID=61305 RepID=UPI003EB87771